MGGQPVAISDVRGDPRFAHDVAESTGYIPQAIVAAPLQTDRGTYGVLSVLDPAVSGVVSDRLLELAALFAQQAAIAVQAAQMTVPGDGPHGDIQALVQELTDEQAHAVAEMIRAFLRYSRPSS